MKRGSSPTPPPLYTYLSNLPFSELKVLVDGLIQHQRHCTNFFHQIQATKLPVLVLFLDTDLSYKYLTKLFSPKSKH
jgi:hypothetical protein